MKIDSKTNMTRKHRWLIVYDVSDSRQRHIIHTILRNHGKPVQYSVFECELNKRQLQMLREQLCKAMADDDSIRWYPLCHWCVSRIGWIGKGNAPQLDHFYIS